MMPPLRRSRSLALTLLVAATAATLSSAFLSPALGGARRLQLAQRQQAAAGAMRAASRLTMSAAGAEWALIFDCDGVILESESLHREAYNAMFKEFEIAYHWDEEYYDELQNKIGGGIPKMRFYFGERGWPTSTLGPAPAEQGAREAMLNTLQDRKTDIYKEMIRGGTAAVRPGVLRLIEEARSLGEARPKLAICSASTKTSCLFVLDNLLGPSVLRHFDLILAGDDVQKRKPDPEIYRLASQRLGVHPHRSIVVEDSLIGLQAALGAEMPCIITHTPSTKSQDFNGAKAIYPELGDAPNVQVTARELMAMALGADAKVGAA